MSSYSFDGQHRQWKQRSESENKAIFAECSIERKHIAQEPIKTNQRSAQQKWPFAHICLLLRLMRAHACLWNSEHVDNRNRWLRHAALTDITVALSNEKKYSSAEVLQKLNVLRATYRYEKRRIKQRIRKGLGAKTKLKWFALADAFLRHVPTSSKLRRNEPCNSDSDLEDAMVFTIDPETLIPLEDDEANNVFDIKQEPMHELDSSSADAVNSPASMSLLETTIPQIWTAEHSLKFVQLLQEHAELWQEQSAVTKQQKSLALQRIADEMDYPVKSIEKRLQVLLRVYKVEKAKILQNVNYRPTFVWWQLLESFLVPHTTASCSSFGNVNADTVQQQTQQPAMTENNEQQSAALSNFSSNDTKLIWHGLEDDLLEGKWSLKHSVKFLRLYGAHPCLWHLKHADYRSRELRQAAIEDIAAAMGYGLTADYVAKKIKIFRITYMQQRKRIFEAKKAGQEADIQLRWFPLADSFLRPHIGLRSIKHQELEIPQFDYQYVYANLNLIDPALLTDFRGKGTQNAIEIGADLDI